jgi:hypothetical protein
MRLYCKIHGISTNMLHSSMRTHSDEDATCLKNTNLCPLSHDATIFVDLLIDRIHPAHVAAVRVVKSNGVQGTNRRMVGSHLATSRWNQRGSTELEKNKKRDKYRCRTPVGLHGEGMQRAPSHFCTAWPPLERKLFFSQKSGGKKLIKKNGKKINNLQKE